MRLYPVMILLALSGCAANDAQFGGAVQNNVVAQVVDMEPVYAGVPLEGSNGERSAEAVRRYRKGDVKALVGRGVVKN